MEHKSGFSHDVFSLVTDNVDLVFKLIDFVLQGCQFVVQIRKSDKMIVFIDFVLVFLSDIDKIIDVGSIDEPHM